MNERRDAYRLCARLQLAGAALALALALCAACGGSDMSAKSDSQAHWLRACTSDSQCGELSCLCGSCSSLCASTVDCGGAAPRCAVPSGSCSDEVQGQRMCLASSSAPGAQPDAEQDDSIVINKQGTRTPPAAEEIPSCRTPGSVAPTTSLPPLFMRTTMGDYEGTMTVNQIIPADRKIVLVANERIGENIELTFNFGLSPHFTLGKRVQAVLRREPGEEARFALLVVRDDSGAVLLAHHHGNDDLFQAGTFDSKAAIGATLSVVIQCQSEAEFPTCFSDQVESEHRGTFAADTTLTLDNDGEGELTIDGAPFDVRFIAGGMDGETPLPGSDCADFAPYRQIMFTLLRQ